MKNSKIQWTDHTVNFWWGCAKVSPACANCYALSIARVYGQNRTSWGVGAKRWFRVEKASEELRRLDRSAQRRGVRERVFVNSMSDTFEDHTSLPQIRQRLFGELETLSNLDALLLTKRPENILRMVPTSWPKQWPSHVWAGTTVENQTCAAERIPILATVPAAVRFLSCEPLLELLDLKPYLGSLQWIIAGGESGPSPRPADTDWIRRIRDDCVRAGVAFHFKQWGGRKPHETGRVLDGRTWDQFPA